MRHRPRSIQDSIAEFVGHCEWKEMAHGDQSGSVGLRAWSVCRRGSNRNFADFRTAWWARYRFSPVSYTHL
eukprot:7092377-Pyramimonas_sp.AAC.1